MAFYHGTNAGLEPGRHLIEPDDDSYAYFTSHLPEATGYAEDKADEHGGSPHVYEVTPSGPYEGDLNDAEPVINYQSEYPLLILREVPDHELR